MKEQEWETIQDRLEHYKYTSLHYTDYEEIADYDIVCSQPELILLLGYHREAKCMEYHWAANSPQELLHGIRERECLLTFIPKEWVSDLEGQGFTVRCLWQDYFMEQLKLGQIPIISEAEMKFLESSECKEASEVTMSCRGQSRGFTGQTAEWMREWLQNEEAEDCAVLTERNEKGEIMGLICTGIYGREREEGSIVWIREVAVRPGYQRQGIARKLLMQALSYGKIHGAKRAFLTADECNIHAIHLYESIGFRKSEEEGQIDMIRGNEITG